MRSSSARAWASPVGPSALGGPSDRRLAPHGPRPPPAAPWPRACMAPASTASHPPRRGRLPQPTLRRCRRWSLPRTSQRHPATSGWRRLRRRPRRRRHRRRPPGGRRSHWRCRSRRGAPRRRRLARAPRCRTRSCCSRSNESSGSRRRRSALLGSAGLRRRSGRPSPLLRRCRARAPGAPGPWAALGRRPCRSPRAVAPAPCRRRGQTPPRPRRPRRCRAGRGAPALARRHGVPGGTRR